MWAIFNFGDPNERYQQFLRVGKPRFQSFIESLLLHDQIVVPTDDYMSLAVLLGVLGQDPVVDLIDGGTISFLRVKGALAYIGNGGGIQAYEILHNRKNRSPFCAPLDEAINWAIGGLAAKVDSNLVVRKAMDATQEVALSTIVDAVRHETYMDILGSSDLRALFAIRNEDMSHLAGVEPNQVRIYGGPDAKDQRSDEIGSVLQLAHANVELRVAEAAGCEDSSTSSPVGHVLKAKEERVSAALSAKESFLVLREISGIPDVGELVLSKRVALRQLMRLRSSRSGEQFREWFHKNCRDDPVKTGKEYVALLKEVPAAQSGLGRVMRFLVTQGLGVVNPVVGGVASAVDSFFLDRLWRGASPKFFIERLEQLADYRTA
jgi:hypothetical protein